ncbi:MAG: hypothetical protein IJU64_07165 [Bacilli bacterium]|nr:hypothetical protein [Bacilli bacterium]
MYIRRAIEKTILDDAKQFPCITIYGARQVGKSTVVAHLWYEGGQKLEAGT